MTTRRGVAALLATTLGLTATGRPGAGKKNQGNGDAQIKVRYEKCKVREGPKYVTCFATCPKGYQAIGGGYDVGGFADQFVITSTRMFFDAGNSVGLIPVGWIVDAEYTPSTSSQGNTARIDVETYCRPI